MSRRFEKTSANLIASEEGISRSSPEFSLDQRRTLLRIAHQAILSVVDRLPFDQAPPFLAGLSDPRGVFTTLYLHGQLRGCVGYAMPVAPLYRAVAETACAAAFEDSRFVPVTKAEGVALQVSLSVLSPLRAMVWSSRKAVAAGFCCRRFRLNMVGTGSGFWIRRAAKPGFR
jgi:AMMECR1 domain-containing protein